MRAKAAVPCRLRLLASHVCSGFECGPHGRGNISNLQRIAHDKHLCLWSTTAQTVGNVFSCSHADSQKHRIGWKFGFCGGFQIAADYSCIGYLLEPAVEMDGDIKLFYQR